MEWLTEPFSAPFMQRTLLAGCLAAVICATVGTYVVLRGLAFMGDALAHGVLPGVAVATLLQVEPMLGAIAGGLVMIGGVTLVTSRSRLSNDTAIGLLFVGMLALGVVIVSKSDAFRGDLVRILFGEVLAVRPSGVIVLAVAAAFTLTVTYVLRRPLLLLCFDPDQAHMAGYSRRLFHFVLLALVGTAVVVSFQVVGTLLVIALLLAPASVGVLVSTRLSRMMVVACATGCVSVFCGLLASWHLDIAAGASIALVAVIVFFVTLAGTGLVRLRRIGAVT
ncbi:MAG: metal ABC transporter permease [Acidimicrobiia bacterium]|nr:metal ABC transporter permease [Acidimicrobiia bacterium]